MAYVKVDKAMNKQQLEAIINGAKTAKITYRERHMIDRFTCMDIPRKIGIIRPWVVSGLLYGYLDNFSVKAVSIDDILQVEV